MKRIIDIIIIATFLMAFSFVGTVAYWLFRPYDVIEFNAPYVTLKSTYKKGEVLTLSIDATQKTNGVKVDVYRSFIDGFVFNFPEVPHYFTQKGRKAYINISTIIPEKTMPGIYRFKTVSVFHVNPIRTIEIIKTTNDFVITD